MRAVDYLTHCGEAVASREICAELRHLSASGSRPRRAQFTLCTSFRLAPIRRGETATRSSA